MFKLAVFSIIFFVLSFSATAEEPLPSELTKFGNPCNVVHDPETSAVVYEEAYKRKTDEFVARQQKRRSGPLQDGEKYDCHYNINTEEHQFSSFERTETVDGNLTESTWFNRREFSFEDCLNVKHVIDCVPRDGGMYRCTFRHVCLFSILGLLTGLAIGLAVLVSCLVVCKLSCPA